ncbi:sex-determining region Y protein [Octopus bimaculoides]|nr:sex-determining region Y protein [Octopus bimaculoides]|eukprot:XP_014776519.1 PREDICTED: sex-determining region Y protein-like [Octopus bimaculoides]
MMVQKNNDKTSCKDQTHSSCQKNCSSNIKRPQNGFIRYSVEKRAEVAAKNPHLDNRNISCVLGSQWKLLSKENREHYQRKFEAEMKDLRKKHPDWMYSNKKNDVDVVLEVMPTRLRPAEKRKKKVLDIFDDIPTKKKIMSKKRIPRCKENVKNSKCHKCKSKLKNNNKRTKSKEEKLSHEKDYNGNDNNNNKKKNENDDSDVFEDRLIIDEAVSSFNATAMASEFPINSSSDVILHGNKTYLPPEMSWELQMNTEYPLLDSLFQPSVDSCNQIAFN